MTIMIGIYQQQEELGKLCQNIGQPAAHLAAVGPFPSKGEALCWQRYLKERIDKCLVLEPSDSEDTKTPWYGYSVEN